MLRSSNLGHIAFRHVLTIGDGRIPRDQPTLNPSLGGCPFDWAVLAEAG
jgi:hypothetical protein